MKAIYAVFEGQKILRMSYNRKELEDYILSFPPHERKSMVLKVKYSSGPREWQQGFWMPCEVKNER